MLASLDGAVLLAGCGALLGEREAYMGKSSMCNCRWLARRVIADLSLTRAMLMVGVDRRARQPAACEEGSRSPGDGVGFATGAGPAAGGAAGRC
jgi:hypothetical protein